MGFRTVLSCFQVLSEEGSETLQSAVQIFALSAVATSAIGFVLGLTDFFKDSLASRLPDSTDPKPLAYSLTVLPPLAFALAYPQMFFNALNFAGRTPSPSSTLGTPQVPLRRCRDPSRAVRGVASLQWGRWYLGQ